MGDCLLDSCLHVVKVEVVAQEPLEQAVVGQVVVEQVVVGEVVAEGFVLENCSHQHLQSLQSGISGFGVCEKKT